MVLMGSPGVGMTVTERLKALRGYEPSPENMHALLTDYFAVDTSISNLKAVSLASQMTG